TRRRRCWTRTARSPRARGRSAYRFSTPFSRRPTLSVRDGRRERIREDLAIFEAAIASRHHLAARFRDHERVLELRRQRAVDGDRGPLVLEHFDLERADVDHRLDREAHARTHAVALPPLADVRDLRWLVKAPADPVADERAHHAAALAFGELLNRRADVADPRAIANLRDADLERAARHLDHLLRFGRGLADVERRRRVAVEAVVDGGDVDVDDVAQL